jgi:hypothetical protein
MPEFLARPLSRLSHSLALVCEDQLVTKNGMKVVLYCDTHVVVAALHGIMEYFDPREGQGRLTTYLSGEEIRFEQPQALVACLLASGWLGSFRLLPPHGAEVARLLDDGRLFPAEGRRNRLIDEFLRAIGFRPEGESEVLSITELNPDEMYALVKRYADQAERAFKAVQCILFTPQERLVRWHKQNLLRATPFDFDYPRLARSKGFSELLLAFSRNRNRQASDYADSVVLVMLRELCRRAEAVGEVPRFFDSTGFLTRMARETGIEEELWTRLPDGSRVRVLVDPDYLIQKASFLSAPGNAGNAGTSLAIDPGDLLARLRKITNGDGTQAETEVVENILQNERIGSVHLSSILDDLSTFAFLKNVWLEELAREELKDFADRFGRKVVESEAFKAELDEAILRLRSDLEEKAKSFAQIYEAWHVLRDGLLRLRKYEKERSVDQELDFDPIRDLELVRFCLPASVGAAVSAIMLKLLDDALEDSQLVRLRRWSELVEKYYAARKDPECDLEAAQVTAAVLWVIKKDKLIVELLERVAGKTDELSVDLFYAAACFRLASGRGEEVLEGLNARLRMLMTEKSFLSSAQREEAANLGIGVGYLSKHLWDRNGHEAWWMRGRGEENGGEINGSGAELLRWAVDSATFAVAMFQATEHRNGIDMKMLYALNQKLFYYTLLGPTEQEQMAEMSTAYRALKERKYRSRELWQATFDDSLARYHHFRSRQAVDPKGVLRQLRQALEYSSRAIKGAPHDDLITGYHSTLVDEVTEVEAKLARLAKRLRQSKKASAKQRR